MSTERRENSTTPDLLDKCSLKERVLRFYLLCEPVCRINYFLCEQLPAKHAGRHAMSYAEAVETFIDSLMRGKRLKYYCDEARNDLRILKEKEKSGTEERRAAIINLLDLAAHPVLNAGLVHSDHLRRIVIGGLLVSLPTVVNETERNMIVEGVRFAVFERPNKTGRLGEQSPPVQVTIIEGVRDVLDQHIRAARAKEADRQWVMASTPLYVSLLRMRAKTIHPIDFSFLKRKDVFEPLPLPKPAEGQLWSILEYYRDHRPLIPESQEAAREACAALLINR